MYLVQGSSIWDSEDIKPNWLLIYIIEGDTITFARSGSHSELFDN